jgi:hypothetical protein
MDGHRFDGLTRALARGRSRRAVLKGLAARLAGLAWPRATGATTRNANGQSCTRATDCASL